MLIYTCTLTSRLYLPEIVANSITLSIQTSTTHHTHGLYTKRWIQCYPTSGPIPRPAFEVKCFQAAGFSFITSDVYLWRGGVQEGGQT